MLQRSLIRFDKSCKTLQIIDQNRLGEHTLVVSWSRTYSEKAKRFASRKEVVSLPIPSVFDSFFKAARTALKEGIIKY